MGLINVNVNELKSIEKDFSSVIIKYDNLVKSFYQRINGITVKTNEWSGADADNFIKVINKNKIIFDNIEKNLKNYSSYLNGLTSEIDRIVKLDSF